MKKNRDQKFKVSGIGKLCLTGLLMCTHYRQDVGGRIKIDDIAVGRPFFVIFNCGAALVKNTAKKNRPKEPAV